MRTLWFLMVLLLPVISALAPDMAAAKLARGPSAVVTEVVDGDTVILEDGTEVRLAGLQAPKLPLGRRGFEAWPLAEEAKAELASLTQGKRVSLSYGGARTDRHGRALAHLHTEDGTWIQGEMLSRGMARVYSFPDNRALVPEMLERERAARAVGRGIWGHEFYRVREAAGDIGPIDTFQIVEGAVMAAAGTRDRTFLNFGPDWRTDFTATIAPGNRKAFAAAGIDPPALEGRRVRVRGWLYERNGPAIDLTHPEQIEIIDTP